MIRRGLLTCYCWLKFPTHLCRYNKRGLSQLRKSNKVTVPAKIGDSLLDVVLDNNVDIDGFGACEGTLACSTCHLIFDKNDFESLKSPISYEEQDLLDLAYDLTDTSRLGCQVIVEEHMDGMVIVVPESIYDMRIFVVLQSRLSFLVIVSIGLYNSGDMDIIHFPRNASELILSENTSTECAQTTKNKNAIKRWKWKKRLEKKHFSRSERKERKLKRKKNAEEGVQSLERLETAQQKAFEYLDQWMNDRENWKFRKLQQSWIINHIFDKEMVSQTYFRIFTQYVEKLTGIGRTNLLERCAKIINLRNSDSSQVEGDSSVNQSINDGVDNNRVMYKRAKRLSKILSNVPNE